MSKMELRTPRDVLAMSRKQRSDLLALRGWGPVLLQNILTEVEKVVEKENKATNRTSSPRVHEDDVPLSGERQSDD
jgi:hypothetical protein